MSRKDALLFDVGDVVTKEDLPELPERLAEGKFDVEVGTCSTCAFQGLGHRVCPLVRCSRYDREDGISVAFVERRAS